MEDTAVIDGDIQYDVWGTKPEDNKATLTVNGGKFTGELDIEEALKEDAKTNIVSMTACSRPHLLMNTLSPARRRLRTWPRRQRLSIRSRSAKQSLRSVT